MADLMPASSLARRQRGVTLVELMVTMTINLFLLLAATLLFLNTRSIQQAVNDRSAVFETGLFAMGLLGRDIGNAGFYPAVGSEPPAVGTGLTVNARLTYDSVAQGLALPVVYAHGIFGCTNGAFDPIGHRCALHKGGVLAGSDSLVLALFTQDAFSAAMGQRADCTRSDVINDTTIARNHVRALSHAPLVATSSGGKPSTVEALRPTEGALPDAPLLVINAYRLRTQNLTLEDGRTVASAALECWGNGGKQWVELVRGVEQFVVRYGVMDDATRTPTRYLSATEVAALTNSVIDGDVFTGWQRVVSVRVCMMVRSPQNSAQRDDADGTAVDVADCIDGSAYKRDNGAQVRRFEQVFSIKNRQGGTIGLRAAS